MGAHEEDPRAGQEKYQELMNQPEWQAKLKRISEIDDYVETSADAVGWSFVQRLRGRESDTQDQP